jgi:rhodanese-related sulfurtransferase
MGKLNKHPILIVLRDGFIVTIACAAVASIVNAVRPDGIAFIENKQYEIFVPCPEPIGEVEPMSPVVFLGMKDYDNVLIIDARSEDAYETWRFPGATHIEFDYLLPVCMGKLKEIAGSGAQKVIVYGDGRSPDNGRELGRELSGNGIKNVFFVEGGAPALRKGKSESAPGAR